MVKGWERDANGWLTPSTDWLAEFHAQAIADARATSAAAGGSMTVGELIKELERMPQDYPVYDHEDEIETVAVRKPDHIWPNRPLRVHVGR